MIYALGEYPTTRHCVLASGYKKFGIGATPPHQTLLPQHSTKLLPAVLFQIPALFLQYIPLPNRPALEFDT